MGSELHLDTKGNCFLCLKEILDAATNGIHTVVCDNFPFLYSLHDVIKYLDIDLGKVFKEKDPITHKMLINQENLRLKVPLCKDCVLLNQQFVKAFQQLEKINLEVVGCIKGIHDQLVGAVSTGHYHRFREIVTSVTETVDEVMFGKLNIVNLLRFEAMRKSASCLYKSKHSEKLQVLKRDIDETGSIPSQVVCNPEPMQSSSKVHFSENVEDSGRKAAAAVVQDRMEVKRNVWNINSDETQTAFALAPGPAMFEPTTTSSTQLDTKKKELKKNKLIPPPIIIYEKQQSSQIVDQHPQPGPLHKIPYVPHQLGATSESTDSLVDSPLLNVNVGDLATTFQDELNLPPQTSGNLGNPGNATYQCMICSKTFKSRSGLYCHSTSVHLNLKYKCLPCNKEYKCTTSYRRHYKAVHMGLRHVCRGCGKTYSQLGHLKYHKQTSCSAEKLNLCFKCDICGKMLSAPNVLRRHIRMVHLEDKEHACSICENRFHLNCELQQHLQKDHNSMSQQ